MNSLYLGEISDHAYRSTMSKFLKKFWKYFKETSQTFQHFSKILGIIQRNMGAAAILLYTTKMTKLNKVQVYYKRRTKHVECIIGAFME